MLTNNSISVIVPIYSCKNCLHELYERLKQSLSKITNNYEIIMINDSSPDEPWELITQLSKKDSRVKGINFSRNFGQHYAIIAGLEYSTSDWIVVMDCDLQDKPEEIIKLYKEVSLGFDIVFAQRKDRKDSFFKRLGSKIFYKLLGYLTDTKQDPSIANFGIYNRKSILAVLSMNDKLKYFPVMIKWVGFKSSIIAIEHSSRQEGKSSYSLSKLISLSIDVMLSFSDKPLKLAVKLGFIISSISLTLSLFIFVRALITGYTIPGWASTIMSIWFLSGLIIFVLGIVGIYIGKTFDQSKDRPAFIIKDKI